MQSTAEEEPVRKALGEPTPMQTRPKPVRGSGRRHQITVNTGDAAVTQKKRSKTPKPNKKSHRPVGQKSRPAAGAAKKSDMKAARHLDKVVNKFEGAVDGLQSNLEQLRETLPELVALGARRDRLRRIKALADDGILDSLQRLATALEDLGPSDLPETLVPHLYSARMSFDHVCRA